MSAWRRALALIVLAWISATFSAQAVAQATGDSPVELTTDLLDHWVAAIRQIGADNLNSPAPGDLLERSQPARLEETCNKAGFASPEQCGCTILYLAVLMTGFDREAQGFIDPSLALQRRISAVL